MVGGISHIPIVCFRWGIISVAIGGNGGTNCVAILNVIIVVFRVSTKVVVIVAVGIIIDVVFGLCFGLVSIFVQDMKLLMRGFDFSPSIYQRA